MNKNPNKFYKIWITITIIGIIWPMMSIALKIASDDFKIVRDIKEYKAPQNENVYNATQRELLHKVQSVQKLFRDYPILDPTVSVPWLKHFALWQKWNDLDAIIYYYTKYVIMNLVILILLLYFKKKILKYTIKFQNFKNLEDNKYIRNVFYYAKLFFILSFQLKIFWGFWIGGIGGWVYNFDKNIIDKPIINPEAKYVDVKDYPYLSKSVIKENIKYAYRNGYLTGNAMFLHFDNGEVLPTNKGIYGFVFNSYLDGTYTGLKRDNQSIIKIVKHRLNYYRDGDGIFLPRSIKYPRHTPYMYIDYKDYPDENLLNKISMWLVTIKIDDGNFKVTHACMKDSIRVKE